MTENLASDQSWKRGMPFVAGAAALMGAALAVSEGDWIYPAAFASFGAFCILLWRYASNLGCKVGLLSLLAVQILWLAYKVLTYQEITS